MSWHQEVYLLAQFLKIGLQCNMRHRKLSRRFSRTSSHRQAMMRNLAISIVEHEIIRTTVEKGKELRRFLEPLITKSKLDNLHTRRVVLSKLGSKDAVKKLFNDLGPRFIDVKGGYLRVIKAGFREGDKADMCYVELTRRVEIAEKLDQTVDLNESASDKLDDIDQASLEVAKEQPTAKEEAPKKTAAKKPAAKEEAPKKTAAKKPAAKEEAPKKTAAKKPAAKEEAPKKTTKKEQPKESWWSRFLK